MNINKLIDEYQTLKNTIAYHCGVNKEGSDHMTIPEAKAAIDNTIEYLDTIIKELNTMKAEL